MQQRIRVSFTLLVMGLATLQAGEATPYTDTIDGLRVVKPWRDPGMFANPIPAAEERAYRERAAKALAMFAGKASRKTDGESEKTSYPMSIGAFLAGDGAQALAVLSAGDGEAGSDHAWSGGMDFYWNFNLKGQVVKWFGLRDQLPAAYAKDYAAAAVIWSASDPRPSLEYVRLLSAPDAQVAAFASEQLSKMWRDAAQLRAMADEAGALAHANFKAFATFIRSQADALGTTKPTDLASWTAWWSTLSAGGWQVFEEYERRTNPNPHPKHGIGKGPVGTDWSPSTRGMRVDARNTDNLRAMREVAVYLFAEEAAANGHAANDLVRRISKERLRLTALQFWSVGNGEWDSETYHAHALTPYLNLYAFAKDEEVRGYAKAILDYLSAAAAVKYWRGAWGGPVKRDYGNVAPFATSAHFCWLWFGDHPKGPSEPERDHVFAMASGYRPPAAAIALSRKAFSDVTTIYSTHPTYETWLPGADAEPNVYETMSWGKTWQMGSLAGGGGYDMNGGKVLIADDVVGARFLIAGMTTAKNASLTNLGSGSDTVAQHGNLQVWVSSAPAAIARVVLPANAELRFDAKRAIVKVGQTWVALTPINLAWNATTAAVPVAKNKEAAGESAGMRLLTSDTSGEGLRGFAMELIDAESDPARFAQWPSAISAFAATTISQREATSLSVSGISGTTIGIGPRGADRMPALTINGVAKDWSQHRTMWKPVAGAPAISLGWKQRVLSLDAGGHRFSGTLSATGAYTWTQTLAVP